MSKEYEKAIKVVLLGESGVGKTNLIRRAMGLEFDSNSLSSLNASYHEDNIIVNNTKYFYQIWDTVGQEIFRSLNKLFIKDSKIVIIVFAIDYKESFNQIDFWLNYAKSILGNDGIIFGLVANKCDLFENQQIPDKNIKEKAEELKIKLNITSAEKDPLGFVNFLNELLTDYINKYLSKGSDENNSNRIHLDKKINKKNNKKKGFKGIFKNCVKK